MQFAVNYSAAAAQLRKEGVVALDRFKCPAWPDLIAKVQKAFPCYVHFPLIVGSGIGDAIDGEANRPADWTQIDRLRDQTETPLLNLHVHVSPFRHPNGIGDASDPRLIEAVTANLIRDVSAVTARFGAEAVMVESDYDSQGRNLGPAFLPEVICRIVEETGCGLLLDLAHARLAARHLGMDDREYTAALPVHRVREIHVTGVQCVTGAWIEVLRQADVDSALTERFAGQWVDHFPMTGEDWELCTWAMEHIHTGSWSKPWAVTFEFGGVGRIWEAIGQRDDLAQQIPRLHDLVKGH